MAENKKQESAVPDTKDTAKKIKPSKPSVGARLAKFWRDYKSELKKVVWCPWKQVRKSTTLVVVSVVIISTVIGLLDLLFSNVFLALGKLI